MSFDLFPVQCDDRFGHLKRTGALIDENLTELTRADHASARKFLGLVIPHKRFFAAALFGALLFAVLAGRVIYVQIVDGDAYRALAQQNRYRREQVLAPRGLILDREGRVLAQNVHTFALTMTLADVPKDDPERGAVLQKISDLSGLARTELDLYMTQAAAHPFDPVILKKGLAYEPAMRLAIETAALPGFALSTSTLRSYDTSAPSLSHVLGYLGKISSSEWKDLPQDAYRSTDDIGKSGIEKSAEILLRGTPGLLVREVNARESEQSLLSKIDPQKGTDILLTIDLELQKVAEKSLRMAMQTAQARRGAAVVVDVESGDVLALVSLPAFDSNAFARGLSNAEYAALTENPDHPLFARAVSGEFPSGSTFKPFVAYGALAEGLINPRTTFLSTGGLRVGEWFFPDWKAGGHGYTDVRKAIAESVNTFFYIVGGGFDDVPGLGVEKMAQVARQFGFGSTTGLDVPGEADGFLPSKEWKERVKGERWYVGDTYHFAIGQGDVLVTPLQMAVATAQIGNGGKKITPHLIKGVDGAGDVRAWWFTDNPVVATTGLSDVHMQTVREGMRQTVTRGSAQSLGWLARPVAGKTGTAQGRADRPTHAWFTGFGPYDDPQIALSILIEEGGEGSRTATPVAADIFSWWFANRKGFDGVEGVKGVTRS